MNSRCVLRAACLLATGLLLAGCSMVMPNNVTLTSVDQWQSGEVNTITFQRAMPAPIPHAAATCSRHLVPHSALIGDSTTATNFRGVLPVHFGLGDDKKPHTLHFRARIEPAADKTTIRFSDVRVGDADNTSPAPDKRMAGIGTNSRSGGAGVAYNQLRLLSAVLFACMAN